MKQGANKQGRIAFLFARLIEYRAKSQTIRALNRGLINIIPFVLVGAVAMALLSLPIPEFQQALRDFTGSYTYRFGEMLSFATAGIVGLAALLSVAYALSNETDEVFRGEISPFVPTFAALSSYIIFYVQDVSSNETLTLPRVGGTGILFSLITAIVSVKLFFAFVRLGKRLQRNRKRSLSADLDLRSGIHAISPLLATLLLMTFVHTLIGNPLRLGVPMEVMAQFAQDWLVSDNFAAVLLTVLVMQVLWFFGVQGSETILTHFPSISNPDAMSNAIDGPSLMGYQSMAEVSQMTNGSTMMATAAQAGDAPLFAIREFYLNFVSLGGAGATIGLLIAMLFVGSAYRGKRLARAALFPSLLNINEILVYGLPIIFNPLIVIPFIGAPLLTASISYAAFASGLVEPITQTTPWTTPILVSGYITTGSISGSLLQLLCVGVSVALYTPVVIFGRRMENDARIQNFDKLRAIAIDAAENETVTVAARNDQMGVLAREFISELHDYFNSQTLPFNLVYQPKTDKEGRVYGAEALLRWEHPVYGFISPVMLIEMTDEANLSTALGRWVIRSGIVQYALWKKAGLTGDGGSPNTGAGGDDAGGDDAGSDDLPNDGSGSGGSPNAGVPNAAGGSPNAGAPSGFRLSINLNPRHLREDLELPEYISKLLKDYDILPGEIDLEITEHVAVHSSETMTKMFHRLRATGVELSIDDMGIGYSSLTYISDYGAQTVKIDISLVSEIASNEQQREIVCSIITLAEQLGLVVIVEGVETKEQMEALVALGCCYFQGYYFSTPLAVESFEAYLQEHGLTAKH